MSPETGPDGAESRLDSLLALARTQPPDPSAALMARVLAEALALQPQPQPAVPRRAAALPRRSPWAALAEAFGGRGVLAGLGAAAVLGLGLGYADPGGLAEQFLSDGGLEMVPAAELILTGG